MIGQGLVGLGYVLGHLGPFRLSFALLNSGVSDELRDRGRIVAMAESVLTAGSFELRIHKGQLTFA